MSWPMVVAPRSDPERCIALSYLLPHTVSILVKLDLEVPRFFTASIWTQQSTLCP